MEELLAALSPSSGTPAAILPWIVGLPLLGALINAIFGKNASRGSISAVAISSVVLAFLGATYAFGRLVASSWGAEEGEHGTAGFVYTAYEWFSISIADGGGSGTYHIPVNVRFVMDHLSGIMTVMVTGIASLIHVYSSAYMGEDPGYRRFMVYLNLFTASMLILVLASNLPLMFVGWEGVGLCSYLLIGFWWENPAYAAAGRKAFVVNRIGDFGVLLGTFLLVSVTHSFEFTGINEAAGELAHAPMEFGFGGLGLTIGTAACLFVFLGCTGKSAQFPLYTWLPDAMAGPTPVSALIHAATMVTAGVYLCCRLSPVFIESEVAMSIIAVVGSLTAFMAAAVGLVQNQMKRILAYSTVSQLGFMFAAVGCGAFGGAIFHVFTHAFFKACLFLGAGSVMHAVHAHGDADIRWLGGMKKYMPRTRWTFFFACLAIAGFPLTSGFFSKDDILFGALEATEHLGWVGWFVFVMLALSALMTAFYMFRLYFRTFEGEFKGGHPPVEGEAHDAAHDDEEEHGHDEPHESEDAITWPLMVLSAGALLVGLLGLPHWMSFGDFHMADYSWWGHWMSGHDLASGPVATWATVAHGEAHEAPGWFGWLAMGVGTAVGLLGIFGAYSLYGNAQDQEATEKTISRVVVVGYRLAFVVALGLGIYGATTAMFTDALAFATTPSFSSASNFLGGAIGLGLAALAALVALGFLIQTFLRVGDANWAHTLLTEKWRTDGMYDALFVRPLQWISVFAANVDRILVDGLLTKVPAEIARGLGWLATRLQNGVIYAYSTLFAVGAAAVVWWFVTPHSTLVGEATGSNVAWTADVGAGYSYRWDFDSDGEWDEDWSSEPTVSHDYSVGSEDEPGDLLQGIVIVLRPASPDLAGGEGLEAEIDVHDGETVLPVDALPDAWLQTTMLDCAGADALGCPPGFECRDTEDECDPAAGGTACAGSCERVGEPILPTIEREGTRIILHRGHAALRGGTETEPLSGDYVLELGESASIGPWRLRVGARVEATVEVRSAFGSVGRVTEEAVVTLPGRTAIELATAGGGAR